MMKWSEYREWRVSPEQVERRRLEAERARAAAAESEAREDALMAELERFGGGYARAGLRGCGDPGD